jgi:hypothetical protein
VATGETTSANAVVLYTVPAGNAFILKSILLTNLGAALVTVQVYLFRGTGNNGPYIINQGLASGANEQFSGWTVLNAGHQLVLVSQAAQVSYWAAGAVLPFA